MRSIPALLLLLATACSGESTAASLRIGLDPWPGYLGLSLATETGCFARQGIPAQTVEFSSLHDMVRAYELGQIDVMPCTLVEVREANRSRRKAEVIYVFDSSRGPDVVLARTGTTPSTSRPARIAYEPASLGAFVLLRYLDIHGIAVAEIEAVPMDQMEMVAAMAAGRVDAAVTYPPASLEIARGEGVRTIFSSAEIPGEIVDVLAVDPVMLDADPTFLERFYAAMREVEHYEEEHPVESVRHKTAVLRITPDAFDATVAGLQLYRCSDQVEWIWSGNQLDRLMLTVDNVFARTPGEHSSIPLHFHCGRRPMPRWLAD